MKRALRGLAVGGFLVFATLEAESVGALQTTVADPLQPLAFLSGAGKEPRRASQAPRECSASTCAS
jgi:hypothetical protein